jgi:hypothetical protein
MRSCTSLPSAGRMTSTLGVARHMASDSMG